MLMEEPVSRFEYLFGRYIANDFTTEEREEFLRLVRKDEYKVSLNALIEEAVEDAVADREISPQRADQLFEKIMQAPFSRSRQRPCELSPAFSKPGPSAHRFVSRGSDG